MRAIVRLEVAYMDIMKVIKERRSVRKYKKDAIPDGIIADIIDAARVAPSWANTQVCQYIIVKDQKSRNFSRTP